MEENLATRQLEIAFEIAKAGTPPVNIDEGMTYEKRMDLLMNNFVTAHRMIIDTVTPEIRRPKTG